MKRINKGPQFNGKHWVYIVLISGFLIAFFSAREVAKHFPSDSLAPAFPVVIVMIFVLAFFVYNAKRNN